MIISSAEMQSNEKGSDLIQSILTMGMGEFELLKKAVKTDTTLFNQLFQNVLSGDRRLAWRSCWILDCASEDFPDLLEGKIPHIIAALLVTKDSSLKRHFTRILCRYTIPEEYQGAIIDRCFGLMVPVEPAAVRVNAMQLLFNISQQIPDLKGELKLVIEALLEEGGSAGFVNRCGKLLRQLRS
jgi:hypothetical protein